MTDIQNLGDVRALLQTLPAGDVQAAENARAREPQLTKPGGSLGRLEDIAEWLATWQGRHPAQVERIKVAVFAGNHGVTAQGVSAFPPEVTFQMVANFEAGGAAINQLCGVAGADLEVVALDLDNPTRDFSQEPAMDDAECTAAFRRGMEAVGADYDVICLGEMGIGNTTPAAAIAHAIHGGEAGDWVGPGTGVEGDALALKVRVVADAVQRHKPAFGDGLDVLASVGGRELAAIAGAITQARLNRQPVVLDGYVCGAAAAALAAAAP
ncbi:MAG: nicotinate-nucleotide--dimethylbenzimidazole phosphoribosyltransferase, partial [Rhodospirillaceae bacterium]|nr:nicotinate-nucleotide--dimethylbenzimidazole phosphoribosyltransferase [Rhodospirillaceae bacterium]